MKRRAFIPGLAALAVLPTGSWAQPLPARNVGIFFGSFDDGDPVAYSELTAFREVLASLGWQERTNINIQSRWAGGRMDRIQSIADDMVRSNLDAIVARATPATAEVVRRTKTIPIVFVQVSDPVAQGFVTSYAHPRTNATGFTNLESSMAGKWAALLKDLLPELMHVTMIYHPPTTIEVERFYSSALTAAAASLGFRASVVAVHNSTEIENAIASIESGGRAALIVTPGSFLAGNHTLIVNAAARHRIPAMHGFGYWAKQGGLMSYGVNTVELFRGAARYVDRILRGEKPGDLPVQTPTRFELIINLQTAKTLGLTIPPMLLARADEVIE